MSLDTVWFVEPVPVRIGIDTGMVNGYDPSTHQIVVESDNGVAQRYELRRFSAPFRERVYLALALSRSQFGNSVRKGT